MTLLGLVLGWPNTNQEHKFTGRIRSTLDEQAPVAGLRGVASGESSLLSPLRKHSYSELASQLRFGRSNRG